jgi:hypothetical protein
MERSLCGGLVLAAGLAAALAACGGNNPTIPTPPANPPTITDTFSGTLNKNGAVIHSFTVAAAGSVSATLTDLAPDSTQPIGMSLGTWNGAACTLVIANPGATKGTAISGQVNSVGNFCVMLNDAAGTLPDRVTYTVTVTHP